MEPNILTVEEFKRLSNELMNHWDLYSWIGDRTVTCDAIRDYFAEKGECVSGAYKKSSKEYLSSLRFLVITEDDQVFLNRTTAGQYAMSMSKVYGVQKKEEQKQLPIGSEAGSKTPTDKIYVSVEEFENEEHQTYRFLYEKLHKAYEQLTDQLNQSKLDNERADHDLKEIHAEKEAVCVQMSELNEIIRQKDIKISELIQNVTNLEARAAELERGLREVANEKTVIDRRAVAQKEDKTDEIMKTAAKVIHQLLHGEMFVISGDRFEMIDSATDMPIETVDQGEWKVSDHRTDGLPTVYEHKLPNWFVETDAPEYTPEWERQKLVKKTKPGLFERIGFSHKKSVEETAKTKDQMIDQALTEREAKVQALLNDKKMGNSEKYLRYMMLTPALGQDYIRTLDAAEQLGIDATIVIGLLEQPEWAHNKEMFAYYVSMLRRNNAYDFKSEVIRELIEQEYYVAGRVNGREEKLTLVPYAYLQELKDQLNHILVEMTEQLTGQCIQHEALDRMSDDRSQAASGFYREESYMVESKDEAKNEGDGENIENIENIDNRNNIENIENEDQAEDDLAPYSYEDTIPAYDASDPEDPMYSEDSGGIVGAFRDYQKSDGSGFDD